MLKIIGFKAKSNIKAVIRTLKKFGPTDFIIFPAPESQKNNLVAKVWYKYQYNSIIAHYMLNKKYKNLFAEYLTQFEKHYRLIIRNLSFKCLPQTLEKKCKKFGPLIEILMPSKNGKNKGFSFIQFKFPKDAKSALQSLNEISICGRSIICDWALEKKIFEKKIRNVCAAQIKMKNKKNKSKKKELNPIIHFLESSFVESISNENSNRKYKIFEKEKKVLGRNLSLFLKNKNPFIKQKLSSSIYGKKKSLTRKCTLFFKNISSKLTEKKIERRFQNVDIEYFLLTINKRLKKNKEIGFIKFKQSQIITKILKILRNLHISDLEDIRKTKSNLSKKSFFINQIIYISFAWKKNILVKQKKNLPDEDSNKDPYFFFDKGKKTFCKQQKQLLRNFNFSISRVRLSVQNLPLNMKDKELKKMFGMTAHILRKEKKYKFKYAIPKIIQVKIIRNEFKKDKMDKSRSLRYGFVQFREHQDALQVMQYCNKIQKLQVEFALENNMVKHIRQRCLKQFSQN